MQTKLIHAAIRSLRGLLVFGLLLIFLFCACVRQDNIKGTSTVERKHIVAATPPNTTKSATVKFSDLRKSLGNEFKNDIKLMSWNIQTLGRTKTDNEILKMAQVMRYFDIIAIQEVVAKDPAGAQAVANIVNELNRMGDNWDYQVSDPTKSSSSYRSERYAFLWKSSKIKQVGRAKLDNELKDKIEREPFIGTFKRSKGVFQLTVVNLHVKVYNENPQEEIKWLIDYPERLQSNYLAICGDFNTHERDGVWQDFYDGGFVNALYNTPTTVARKCKNGSYESHPIDNIYYSNNIMAKMSGKIDFIESCDSIANRHISDHFPIFFVF